MVQIVQKGVPHVLIGGFQIGLPLLRGQRIQGQPHLAVVGGKEAAVLDIDALFHVDGALEVLPALPVIQGHVGHLPAALEHRGAEEKDIGALGLVGLQIGPVAGVGIKALAGGVAVRCAGAAGQQDRQQEEQQGEGGFFHHGCASPF